MVFGNISENKITLTKVVSLEQRFATKPEVCEMDGIFQLQNGLTLLSSIITSRSKSKKAHDINLMLKMVFKICSNFSESASLRIAKQIRLSGNFDFFSVIVLWTTVFSLVDHNIRICIKI